MFFFCENGIYFSGPSHYKYVLLLLFLLMLMSVKEIDFRAKKKTNTSTLCGKFNESHLIG